MKKLFISAAFILLPYLMQAQMLGLANSNYAGTNGIYMNPSSIADSRYKFYFNLISAEFNITNNYIKYNAPFSLTDYLIDNVPNQYRNSLGQVDIRKEYLEENLNGKPKNFNMGLDIKGPSFMVGLGPRSALAITTRVRGSVQINNMSENFAKIVRTYIYDQNLVDVQNLLVTDNKVSLNVNTSSEIGLSFAQVVLNQETQFLKVGGTVKRVVGLYSAYMQNEGLSLEIQPNSGGPNQPPTINIPFAANIGIGYINKDQSYFQNFSTSRIFNMLLGKDALGAGVGFDFGVTYEFRPNYDKYIYTMDGVDRFDEGKNKYKLKVGLSVTDIGRIRYDDPDIYNYQLHNKTNASIKVADLENAETEADMYKVVTDALGINLNDRTTTMFSALPTTLNLNVDYNIAWNVYLNATWMQSLRPKNIIGMRQNSLVCLTPRLEMKWFEIAFPFSMINDYQTFAFGTMIRAGTFFIGSDNIGGLLNIGKLNGANIYAGATIPLYRSRIKDRDKDGVSNKLDECIDTPGIWEFKGCPDTDGDGIQDKEDACVTIPGLKEFNGCPDTDKDGIPDAKDDCPTEPGLAEFNGCPDKDGDKIIDSKDDCPDVAGLAKFNGCPDTDNDGLMDKVDKCPNDPGPVQYDGCPDRDGDGVLDMVDKCPDTPGLPQYNGCPDRDLDTVPDMVDKCPDTFGSPENSGCPLVKVVEKITIIQLAPEEAKVLKEAFDNLEFETGKAIIKEESFPSLAELAELLQKKTEYRLLASGHTDNVGKASANLKLSEKRAAAVKAYLVERGVDSDQIVTEGFGSKRPIATNKTVAGRQKNRRVEMKIIK